MEDVLATTHSKPVTICRRKTYIPNSRYITRKIKPWPHEPKIRISPNFISLPRLGLKDLAPRTQVELYLWSPRVQVQIQTQAQD